MSLWGPPYIQVKMFYLWHLIIQNVFVYKLIQDLTIPTPFTSPSLGRAGAKESKGGEANTVKVHDIFKNNCLYETEHFAQWIYPPKSWGSSTLQGHIKTQKQSLNDEPLFKTWVIYSWSVMTQNKYSYSKQGGEGLRWDYRNKTQNTARSKLIREYIKFSSLLEMAASFEFHHLWAAWILTIHVASFLEWFYQCLPPS